MEKNHNSAVIFDGDDTLWQTQPLYEAAMDKFAQLVGDELSVQEDIRTRLINLDCSRVSALGFGKKRFLGSMVETYRQLCAEVDKCPMDETLSMIASIGDSVSTTRPLPIKGVRRVLNVLSQHFDLYLYTGGEESEQKDKARNLGLYDFFSAIECPEQKTEIELQNFLNRYCLSPSTTWLVGNSPRSDINPGLKIGLRCIWFNSESWIFDSEPILNGEVWEVHQLLDILPILISM